MRKQHILYIVVILLSIINIINTNNTSALSYSSSVGIGFTFNPTLSVSISPPDLTIPNLSPGTTADSNIINVSVASNAAYGYTLSAIVNGNNSNLTHANGTNVFSSMATNANLPSLENSEDTNIWGYSYKDNTVDTPTWSNYNGLSNSNSATLLDTNTNNTETGIDSVDFKIAAKASNTQPSGTYTGTINFTAVTNVAPMSLLDSFIASGAEMYNGYFKMQDMTHDICESVDIEESELQLIDVRDNKVYWVAKLKDDNCWMTQNLDLDLSNEVALTSKTSDMDPDSYGKTIYAAENGYSKDEATGTVSWLPSTIVEVDDGQGGTIQVQRANTIDMVWSSNSITAPGWANNTYEPYSANPGDRYRYTNTSSHNEISYDSLKTCANGNNDLLGCQHAHLGNYYNWSAAVASNNTVNIKAGTANNSICPKNWNIPPNGKYNTLLQKQDIQNNSSYLADGFLKIRTSPLYFIQSGAINDGSLNLLGGYGTYWSSTIDVVERIYTLLFRSNAIYPSTNFNRFYGMPIRCIAK